MTAQRCCTTTFAYAHAAGCENYGRDEAPEVVDPHDVLNSGGRDLSEHADPPHDLDDDDNPNAHEWWEMY